jgi:methionyl-tRNA formyltransferase
MAISVLFFGRESCGASLRAFEHLKCLGFDVTFIKSKCRAEPMPEGALSWGGDYILCFRSFFVLRRSLLDKARIAAINFHPGPPEYPGSGCLNFALYDDAKTYGVTAHIMNEKIDNGPILECRRFPILPNDGVDSLLRRTHVKLTELFLEFCSGIASDGRAFVDRKRAESSGEKWFGEARKMIEFEKLKEIDSSFKAEQVDRVVRATYTELYPPKILLHGYEFVLKNPNPKR